MLIVTALRLKMQVPFGKMIVDAIHSVPQVIASVASTATPANVRPLVEPATASRDVWQYSGLAVLIGLNRLVAECFPGVDDALFLIVEELRCKDRKCFYTQPEATGKISL